MLGNNNDAFIYPEEVIHTNFEDFLQSNINELKTNIAKINKKKCITSDDMLFRATCYFQLREYDKSLEDVNILLEKDDRNISALIIFGRILVTKKDFSKALQNLTLALEISKKKKLNILTITSTTYLAYTNLMIKRYNDCISLLLQIIDLPTLNKENAKLIGSDNIVIIFLSSLALALTKKPSPDYSNAIKVHKIILEISPSYIISSLELSNIYFTLKKNKSAFEMASLARDSDPYNKTAYKLLLQYYLYIKDWELVISCLFEIYKIDNNDLKNIYDIINICIKEKMHHKAHLYLEKALELSPNNFSILSKISSVSLLLGKYKQALAYYYKADLACSLRVKNTDLYKISFLSNTSFCHLKLMDINQAFKSGIAISDVSKTNINFLEILVENVTYLRKEEIKLHKDKILKLVAQHCIFKSKHPYILKIKENFQKLLSKLSNSVYKKPYLKTHQDLDFSSFCFFSISESKDKKIIIEISINLLKAMVHKTSPTIEKCEEMVNYLCSMQSDVANEIIDLLLNCIFRCRCLCTKKIKETLIPECKNR